MNAHSDRDPAQASGRSTPPEARTLQVEVKLDRDRLLVCPAGEVDLLTAATLESRILDLLRGGFDRVVVDLRAVTFLDSTGIRVLLSAHHRAREDGRSFSIILGGPATRRPLEILGLTEYLDLEPDGSDGSHAT
jgi:anti-anti-sigma factor